VHGGVHFCALAPKRQLVPAEGGCCVFLGGGSGVSVVVSGGRVGISGDCSRISGTGVGVSAAEGRVIEAGSEVVPLGAE
jgi:hypothetical protein